MSAATASTLRPSTPAWMSTYRETASRSMTDGDGTTRTSATWSRRTCPPLGCVDQHVADALDATSGGRRAPHDDIEHLLLFEDAADLDALQQRRLGATHVTRGEAERLCLRKVDLDLDRRLQVRDALRASTTPSTSAITARTRSACVRSTVEVLAEHTHDERLVGASEHVEALAPDRVVTGGQRTHVLDPLLARR